jgi:TonB family protein
MRSDEDIRGWVGSLLFHVLLGGFLFLWQVSVTTGEPEYIEVSLGGSSAEDDGARIEGGGNKDVADVPLQVRTNVGTNLPVRKDRGTWKSLGTRERLAKPGRRSSSGIVSAPRSTGVSMTMAWMEGGARKKISGDLPEYPPGTRVKAQLKIEAVVEPDGTVKSLKPVRKGNTNLEKAAIKAVRSWRFEPLRRSSAQREQVCTITFAFHLR